jgi:hypothetical protein
VRQEEGSEFVELGLGFRKGAGRGRGASGGKLRKGGIASAIVVRLQPFSLACSRKGSEFRSIDAKFFCFFFVNASELCSLAADKSQEITVCSVFFFP